jgi:copper(I)-binding protein
MHESISSGASSSMQRIDTLLLHAGESMVFSPGGRHFMVIEPDSLPLPGEPPATFPIQFQFESGRTLVVGFSAEVTKP